MKEQLEFIHSRKAHSIQRKAEPQVYTIAKMVDHTEEPFMTRRGYYLFSDSLWNIFSGAPCVVQDIAVLTFDRWSFVVQLSCSVVKSAPASICYHLQQTTGWNKRECSLCEEEKSTLRAKVKVHSLCKCIRYTSKNGTGASFQARRNMHVVKQNRSQHFSPSPSATAFLIAWVALGC